MSKALPNMWSSVPWIEVQVELSQYFSSSFILHIVKCNTLIPNMSICHLLKWKSQQFLVDTQQAFGDYLNGEVFFEELLIYTVLEFFRSSHVVV